MSWLNWNDLLAPSNPYAAVFFGIILTLIVACSIWYETKQKRILFIAIVTGGLTTVIGVGLLTMIGFY
ncbi:hypothetical protein [Rossellomorea aquimaris]|jgi:hypothetical protein|uniref:Uncharacterized protein n=1 Tax=Rossellomorea aquimaris TaxID=189382 RepID=A0A5D4UBD0_9BACI|nr:hypothetical protein [Rossellomorea aquimaris]TYS78847.1 hypothetical protein FZD05_09945 [Rossellomorea aquimaris]TYS84592.1 hypothetical protein FZC85_14575 [Rossellomorea aquimaris]TYS91493.1 hypothetical protein FZC88_04925 [Rossellomorea aquimaris]